MNARLPEEAQRYFAQQAASLVQRLKRKTTTRSQSGQRSTSERHVTSIPAHQVKVTKSSSVDGFGVVLGRYFIVGDQEVGLEDDDYRVLDRFADQLSNRPEFRQLLSKEFVLDAFFEWAQKRATHQITLDNFIAALDVAAFHAIRQYDIAIPVDHLTIPKDFTIGKVRFGVLSKDLFDEVERKIKKDPESQPSEESLARLRITYQGFTVALMSLTAEPRRAVQLAVDALEDALLVLRFYSGAGVLLEAPCYLGRRGTVLVPSLNFLMLDPGTGHIEQIVDQCDEPRDPHVHLDEDLLSTLQTTGFPIACEIVAKVAEARTELEESVLRAMEIFNSGLRSSRLADKIVADLVTLETLFLRDANEPIQASLTRRVAVLTRRNLEDRKAVVSTILKAHQIRGKYLHHGLSPEQNDVLASVHQIAWDAVNAVLQATRKFKDVKELLSQADDYLLS
jgi:Apea-like HEPN